LGVFFEVVHGLEALFRHLAADRLIDTGKSLNGLAVVVEVLVVLFHVGAVGVGYGYIVGELWVPRMRFSTIVPVLESSSLAVSALQDRFLNFEL
jgi:hypothetical protein